MKKILALGAFLGLLSLSVQAGTVAYYEFNGTGLAPVGSTITDSTGNHHGTVAGGDLEYGMDPLAGSYLRFDSNSVDRVEIAGAPDLVFHTDGAYTIEVVFRTRMLTSAVGALVSKGADVSNPIPIGGCGIGTARGDGTDRRGGQHHGRLGHHRFGHSAQRRQLASRGAGVQWHREPQTARDYWMGC
jgi:hypothetical protein